jgi:hypothetical protein
VTVIPEHYQFGYMPFKFTLFNRLFDYVVYKNVRPQRPELDGPPNEYIGSFIVTLTFAVVFLL